VSRYVVIEGLIGVGKTSLCRLCRDQLSAELVLEPCEDNPFLASFYADPERFAFPAQMFYLASRFQQQQALRQANLFHDLVVSDYLFDKDRLFAELTLTGHEMALYDRFACLLAEGIPKPDFVLFLDAPTEVIRSRIRRRAIDAEQVISADYLDSLRDKYLALWARFDAAPVHVLDTTTLNYVDDPADRETVLGMIRAWLADPNSPVGSPASPSEREEQPSLFGTGVNQGA